jgi:hypothetical protein
MLLRFAGQKRDAEEGARKERVSPEQETSPNVQRDGITAAFGNPRDRRDAGFPPGPDAAVPCTIHDSRSPSRKVIASGVERVDGDLPALHADQIGSDILGNPIST